MVESKAVEMREEPGKSTSKAAPTAPLVSSKAGAPRKRGWDEDEMPSPDSKAPQARMATSKFGGPPPPAPSGNDGGGGKGGGAPTSKARWAGAEPPAPPAPPPAPPAPPAAKGFDGKGKGKGSDYSKGGYDAKGAGYDGGKGAAYGYDGGKGGGYDANGAGYGANDYKGAGGKGGSYGGKDLGKGMDKGQAKAEVHEMPTAEDRDSWKLSPADMKKALQMDTLLESQATAGIEVFKSAGVDLELAQLTKRLVPNDEGRRGAQRILALVRSALGAPGPGVPGVDLAGSHAQGCEVMGSAIDLAFRLPANFTFEQKQNCVSELRNRLMQQSEFLELCETLEHYPHTTSPMSIDLKGAQPGLVAHVLLDEQRENRPPTLDEIIKQLLDTFQASYELVRLVKLWSVNHGLTDQSGGYINGLAWTLLVIFYLQKSQLIPPYQIISQGTQITPQQSTLPMSTHLQQFFEFLKDQSATRGISVFKGESFEGPPAVFIEDPAAFLETRQQKSLSETLREQPWNKIIEEAKKACSRIKVRPGRWFHWAEVFDPTDRKPEKIMGLSASLSGGDMGGDGGKGAAPHSDVKGSGKGKDDGKGFGSKGTESSANAKGDAKGDAKGHGKDSGFKGGKDSSDGKGAPWSGKDGGKDSGKGYSDGKGDAYGKDAGKGKDSFGKGDSKGYGKDFGKDSFGKDKGKGYKPY